MHKEITKAEQNGDLQERRPIQLISKIKGTPSQRKHHFLPRIVFTLLLQEKEDLHDEQNFEQSLRRKKCFASVVCTPNRFCLGEGSGERIKKRRQFLLTGKPDETLKFTDAELLLLEPEMDNTFLPPKQRGDPTQLIQLTQKVSTLFLKKQFLALLGSSTFTKTG